MSRLRAVARDVRAPGVGAPLRAAYEASTRVGGHSVAFGALARRPPGTATRTAVYRLPAPTAAAGERCRAEADRIAAGTVVLFGQAIEVGAEPDWHASHDPAAPGSRWPDGPWWQIDLRSAARVADVKWAWELGRHRHLVVLARAASTADPDPAWAATLGRHLESWLHHNPPEHGVHWYSNLEIALRAMTWLEVLERAAPHLAPEVRRAMDEHLQHAGAHLLLDLSYTLSTMRNNHLLGDALGLVTLARAFPDDSASGVWDEVGTRLLRAQVDREVRPDGSMIEDSVSYHRFVLELLCRRALLGDAPDDILAALDRSARFLCRLGALDGSVPQYGDWDEGRALAAGGDPSALAGSARVALGLCGHGAPPDWRDAHDEVAWYVPEGRPAPGDGSQVDGHAVGGGVARVERGSVTVWCKAGGGPWHGHADHGSVAVRHGDTWLIGDPGTGNYNGRDVGRAFLRSSEAHSVLMLDGEDQLVPHRAFRWVHSATGRIGPPVALPDAQVLWCAHDAYRRLTPSRRIARVVVTSSTGVVVADWVEGPPGPDWSLTLPLAPGTAWDAGEIRTAEGIGARLDLLTDGAHLDAHDGPWSETYGSAEPATRLVAGGTVGGPIAWALTLCDPPPAGATEVDGGGGSGGGDRGHDRSDDPAAGDIGASGPSGGGGASVHGDVLRVDGASITVDWQVGAVELVVDHPEVDLAHRPAVVLR